jgi:hypothetical protein
MSDVSMLSLVTLNVIMPSAIVLVVNRICIELTATVCLLTKKALAYSAKE